MENTNQNQTQNSLVRCKKVGHKWEAQIDIPVVKETKLKKEKAIKEVLKKANDIVMSHLKDENLNSNIEMSDEEFKSRTFDSNKCLIQSVSRIVKDAIDEVVSQKNTFNGCSITIESEKSVDGFPIDQTENNSLGYGFLYKGAAVTIKVATKNKDSYFSKRNELLRYSFELMNELVKAYPQRRI